MDAEMLRYWARKRKKPLARLAGEIGINPVTLHRKMTGESDFTRAEILAVQDALHLSIQDVASIFFTDNLR